MTVIILAGHRQNLGQNIVLYWAAATGKAYYNQYSSSKHQTFSERSCVSARRFHFRASEGTQLPLTVI
jgi:hypothetical protein